MMPPPMGMMPPPPPPPSSQPPPPPSAPLPPWQQQAPPPPPTSSMATSTPLPWQQSKYPTRIWCSACQTPAGSRQGGVAAFWRRLVTVCPLLLPRRHHHHHLQHRHAASMAAAPTAFCVCSSAPSAHRNRIHGAASSRGPAPLAPRRPSAATPTTSGLHQHDVCSAAPSATHGPFQFCYHDGDGSSGHATLWDAPRPSSSSPTELILNCSCPTAPPPPSHDSVRLIDATVHRGVVSSCERLHPFCCCSAAVVMETRPPFMVSVLQ